MSGFLLDTDVISELVKPQPEPNVTAWIEGTDESLLYLSVLTWGGLIRISVRALRIESWLSTRKVADRWGLLTAAARNSGIVLRVVGPNYSFFSGIDPEVCNRNTILVVHDD